MSLVGQIGRTNEIRTSINKPCGLQLDRAQEHLIEHLRATDQQLAKGEAARRQRLSDRFAYERAC